MRGVTSVVNNYFKNSQFWLVQSQCGNVCYLCWYYTLSTSSHLGEHMIVDTEWHGSTMWRWPGA